MCGDKAPENRHYAASASLKSSITHEISSICDELLTWICDINSNLDLNFSKTQTKRLKTVYFFFFLTLSHKLSIMSGGAATKQLRYFQMITQLCVCVTRQWMRWSGWCWHPNLFRDIRKSLRISLWWDRCHSIFFFFLWLLQRERNAKNVSAYFGSFRRLRAGRELHSKCTTAILKLTPSKLWKVKFQKNLNVV